MKEVLIPKAEMLIHDTVTVPGGVRLVGEVTVRACNCCDWTDKEMFRGEWDTASPVLNLAQSSPVSGFYLLPG